MSLHSLPTELLEFVGGNISSIQTLNALSRVNRRFRDVFEPLLYRRDARCDPPSVAVCWAAQHGMAVTLERCLEYGAEITTCSPPPQYSGEFKRRYCYGASVLWDIPDPAPPHPVCLAVQGGHLAMAEFFLDRGCDVNMLNPEGFPLVSLAVVNSHIQLVDVLLRRGASQTPEIWEMPSPIQIAAFLGNKDLVELLWRYGSGCLRPNYELHGALESAMAMEHKEITHLVINYGAILNMTFNNHGVITPLQWATEMGDVDTVELLLSEGARPDYAFRDEECALARAALKNDERIASLVIDGTKRRAKTMALAFSAEHADGCVARLLLSRGTRPDFADDDYRDHFPTTDRNFCLIPPLVRAVNARQGHLVRLLVEHGASVNAHYKGLVQSQSSHREGSVLKLAIDLGDEDIVSFLLQHGAQEEVGSRWDRVRERAMEGNSRGGKQRERGD